jgi:hypothetical protein
MSVTFLDQDGVARLVGTILGITPGGNLAATLAAGNDALGQKIAGLGDPTNPQDADTLFSRDAAIAVVLLDPRFPTTDEKAALVGTAGAPAAGNPYVTTTDARNADARTPTAHVHAEADVTNLGSDLAGKAASVHTHVEGDVTNLASDLAGKAAASHTHAEADITSLVADLALKEPGSPVIWTTVIKGSDTSIASSTAVANDPALLFATVNGAVYEIELVIIHGSPLGGTTPDIKFDLGEDNAARGAYASRGVGTSDAISVQNALTDQTTAVAFGTTTSNRAVQVKGIHTAGGGTFRLRWAQNVSNVGATIVRAGSLLRFRRII